MNLIFSVILGILFVIILMLLFFFRDNTFNWCRKNKKKILGLGTIITVVSAGTGYILMSLGDEQPPVVDHSAYIWHPGAGYGGIPHWEINKTYAKQFLKDNMHWRLQASPNNNIWYNANEFLKISLDWNESDCSYKVTLTLNTTTAPQSLYYRFDFACNKSLKQFFETDGYEWILTVPANLTKEYILKFNWSDLKPLIQNGKIWFDRGVKDNFFWFRIQTVNKINPGLIFVVDPVYGVMPASVTDTYEWDNVFGIYVDSVRVNNSEYYLIVSTETASATGDPCANTIQIWNDNGSIKKSSISEYIFDTTGDGLAYCSVIHIPNSDKYAVAYYDVTGAKVTVVTFRVYDNNGTINKVLIDSQILTTSGIWVNITRLTDHVYAVTYSEGTTSDGYVDTIWINTSGTINNTLLDSEEYETDFGARARLCLLDSNSFVINYIATGADGWLMTYNFTSSGLITDTPADSWEYDTDNVRNPTILPISGNIYGVTYQNLSYAGFLKTVTINATGTITKAWNDAFTFETGVSPRDSNFSRLYKIQPGIYAIVYQGSSTDGWIKTINITNAGDIDVSIIDSLEFDAVDNMYMNSMIYVNKSWYLVVYTSTGSDGWSCTVNILTNWASPIVSSPSPVNVSIDQALTPTCAITVNDMNGDTMTLTFAENSTGSWINRQTNLTCANGTYRWTYAQATVGNTKYWWKVYANDGLHNISNWYCFTTVSSGWTDIIRNNGLDYFVWLGVNTTANVVATYITGFDEASESISIWNLTSWNAGIGLWETYYGDASGTVWTVHTFSIIKIVMDDSAGTQTITMPANPSMNYTNTKAIKLVNTTVNRGYNFSVYNRATSTTLSAINTTAIGLTTGDFVARWNQTTYAWDIWISGFGPNNYAVSQWDVIQTKVSNAETWNT